MSWFDHEKLRKALTPFLNDPNEVDALIKNLQLTTPTKSSVDVLLHPLISSSLTNQEARPSSVMISKEPVEDIIHRIPFLLSVS